MSRADYIFLKTTNSILKNGSWEQGNVRPHWSDKTPAYTIKKFSVNNIYHLNEEFPITSLRNTNWRAAVDEILWIWIKKSNNINDLNSHIWDQWTDESGSIGEAYGAQVRKLSKYKEGMFDQMDRILYQLKNSVDIRRVIAELYVHEDLHKMHLYPCVHGLNFVVTDDKSGKLTLNLLLNQRSNDTLAAGNWNVVQYAVLLHMIAQVCDMNVGDLSHIIADSHIYDRHIPFVFDMTFSRAKQIQNRLKDSKLCEMIGMINDEKLREKFETFKREILESEVEFDSAIEVAKEYEKMNKDEIGLDHNFSNEMRTYNQKTLETPQFECAEKIINEMYNNKEFEKILGYETPKLLLDKKVRDLYSFVSPKTRDKDGKIINNENSSFDIANYHPENEGIKFEAKVPVAE